MQRFISTSFSVLLLGTAIAWPILATPVSAKERVAQEDMQRYCQGRAAEKFHVSPRDILTLPLERSGDGFIVYGQYPQDGRDVTTFECHFGGGGRLKRVKATSDGGGGEDRAGEPVAERDMQRFCMGEAADAFDQRPQDILTLPVERDPGGYVVYGQYPLEGRRVTTFECHYDSSRVFRTVYEN